MARGDNRARIGVSKNLLTEISKQFPNASASQALELFIIQNLKSNKAAEIARGNNNEQRQASKYKG